MPHISPKPQRNTLGAAALLVGLLAAGLLAVPLVGVFAAAPCGLLAVAFSLSEVMRIDDRTATHKGVALAGGIVGLAALIAAMVLLTATMTPTVE